MAPRCIAAFLLLSSACGLGADLQDRGARGNLQDREAETGTVVSIQDGVPVDRAVDIVLLLDDGTTDVAYLPSAFTMPSPPLPEWSEAYQMLRDLQPGDRITVIGERAAEGLRIEAVLRVAGRTSNPHFTSDNVLYGDSGATGSTPPASPPPPPPSPPDPPSAPA